MLKVKTTDTYIEVASKEAQPHLKQMRKIIKTMAPYAQEYISYGMPMYKLGGKQFLSFAGFSRHMTLFVLSGTFLDNFKTDLKNFSKTKSGVHFFYAKPLPVALIKKLIKAKMKMLL